MYISIIFVGEKRGPIGRLKTEKPLYHVSESALESARSPLDNDPRDRCIL